MGFPTNLKFPFYPQMYRQLLKDINKHILLKTFTYWFHPFQAKNIILFYRKMTYQINLKDDPYVKEALVFIPFEIFYGTERTDFYGEVVVPMEFAKHPTISEVNRSFYYNEFDNLEYRFKDNYIIWRQFLMYQKYGRIESYIFPIRNYNLNSKDIFYWVNPSVNQALPILVLERNVDGQMKRYYFDYLPYLHEIQFDPKKSIQYPCCPWSYCGYPCLNSITKFIRTKLFSSITNYEELPQDEDPH